MRHRVVLLHAGDIGHLPLSIGLLEGIVSPSTLHDVQSCAHLNEKDKFVFINRFVAAF